MSKANILHRTEKYYGAKNVGVVQDLKLQQQKLKAYIFEKRNKCRRQRLHLVLSTSLLT